MKRMTSKKTLILILIPILTVATYIFAFGLNIPFWDQWANVALLMKQHQGTLSLTDLFAQHNEHRPFFPRLIWIALASITHYNVKTELWVNLLIAVLFFSFFVIRAFRTWREYQITPPVILIPLLSLLIFNLGHRESWLQGFQTVMFLGTACVITGFFLIADNMLITYLISICLGGVATFSMANGLLFWPIGLILLILSKDQNYRKTKIIFWLICSFCISALFLLNWHSAANINFANLFSNFFEWVTWILNFLGAPLFAFWYVSWIFGILSIYLYSYIFIQLYKENNWRPAIPYVGVVLFILGTTLIISLGRMEFGLRQSTVSRYLTMSAWYWAALLTLLPLIKLRHIPNRFLYLFFAASLALLTLSGGIVGYIRLYQRILPAYEMVVNGDPINNDVMINIYPVPEDITTQIDFLKINQLSAWREVR